MKKQAVNAQLSKPWTKNSKNAHTHTHTPLTDFSFILNLKWLDLELKRVSDWSLIEIIVEASGYTVTISAAISQDVNHKGLSTDIVAQIITE